jgi:lipopolysaccharide biosynthesis regulator YciM
MSVVAACVLGDAALRDGETEEALAAYRRAWHSVQEHPRINAYQRICARVQAGLATAYAATGERDRAAELLSRAMQIAAESELPEHAAAAASQAELYWAIAVACIRLDDLQQGVEGLRRAVAAGWADRCWFVNDPELRPLHGHPGFAALVDAVGRMPRIEFDAV